MAEPNTCPHCGTPLPASPDAFCHVCLRRFDEPLPEKPEGGFQGWYVGVPLIVFGGLLLLMGIRIGLPEERDPAFVAGWLCGIFSPGLLLSLLGLWLCRWTPGKSNGKDGESA